MNIYNLAQIETPRLIIRPVQLGDEIELNAAIQHSLPSLQRWMPWSKDPSIQTTREHIQRGVHAWASGNARDFPMVVIHKNDNTIISGSGFNEKSDLSKPYFEIGYWIDSRYEGQGLVTELVNALTRYALDALHATRVQICTQVENERSILVAKRNAYECEATLKNDRLDCVSGLPSDSYLFACCDAGVLPELAVSWEHVAQRQPNKASMLQPKSSKNPGKCPTLTTKRLVLKAPELIDINPFHEALLASTAEVNPWFTWAKPDVTVDAIKNHIEEAIKAARDMQAHDHLFFIVWDTHNDRFLGEVWYKIFDWDVANIMVNYWFDTRCTGHGYASEAIAELIKYAFTGLNAKRVQATISEKNEHSLPGRVRLDV